MSRRAGAQAGVFVVAVAGLVAGLMITLNYTVDVPLPARDRGATSPPSPSAGASRALIATRQPLAAILAPDTRHSGARLLRGCAMSPGTVASLGLAGVQDSVACSAPAATMIRLSAYQFGTASEYTRGFTRLAAAAGWRASRSGSRCPARSRTAMGRVPWQDPPAYPPHPGQVLDCDGAPRAGAPEFVWSIPAQRAVFTAVDTRPGATYGSLWAWLKSVRFD